MAKHSRDSVPDLSDGDGVGDDHADVDPHDATFFGAAGEWSAPGTSPAASASISAR